MTLETEFRTRTFEDVRRALLERREVALLDVREEDPHARSHPLFAANLPLSKLELEAPVRLPRRSVPIVVLDDGEGLAGRAARRFTELGYTDVTLLAGGLRGWAEAGGELFQDVNAPSKAFGELVESERHTPSLEAPQLQALLDSDGDVVVLDARRFERVSDHEHSGQRQRAWCGAGVARPATGAEPGHADCRQLCRAHASASLVRSR